MNTIQNPSDSKSSAASYLSSMHSYRIGILDDHPIAMCGLVSILREASGRYDLVLEEDSAEDFYAHLQQISCDAVILDFYLSDTGLDGVSYIKRVRAKFPKLGIVVLSAMNDINAEYIVSRAGANAFLSKRNSPMLLLDLLPLVSKNPKSFFSFSESTGSWVRSAPKLAENQLTVGEIEVLRHIAEGMTVSAIAEKLFKSKKTISTHKRRAMKKLGISGDVGLATYLKNNFSSR